MCVCSKVSDKGSDSTLIAKFRCRYLRLLRPAPAAYDRQRAWLAQTFAPNRWGILTYHKEDEAVQVRCRPLLKADIHADDNTPVARDILWPAGPEGGAPTRFGEGGGQNFPP